MSTKQHGERMKSTFLGFPQRNPDLDPLPGFKTPPQGYGEVAFYWWMGDPLDRERLLWQLDQLVGKGIMGLQINYAHSDRGGLSWGLSYPSQPPLFSQEWWELFDWFAHEANQRGMAVSLSDYTLGIGQGWYIDETIADHPELRGSELRMVSYEIRGGEQRSLLIPQSALSVMAFCPGTASSSLENGIDLRPEINQGNLTWTAPATQPLWQIVVVSAETIPHSLDPMNPATGKEVIQRFFQRFEDHLPNQGGKGLNFFFSDELEFGLKGRIWTARFAAEFQARKGYDLIPELPALWFDLGPRTAKVRLDYNDVRVALAEAGYFRPVYEWHQQRGMIYGCDHGGRGLQVDEFGDYFRTQKWNQGPGCDQPMLQHDLIKNKVASSIAHLYERPRVWLEGFHSSGWGTSSADLTRATLINFVQGQNLLSLHGLYYSTHGGWWEWAPPCNHFRMPYWKHFNAYMDCVQRLSYLLSQGVHRCDVAILYPVAPIEAGMDSERAVQLSFRLGQALYNQGIDFDFIDFESLERSQIEENELTIAGERYRALILPAMSAARFSTVEKALQFKQADGLVLMPGSVPTASERIGGNDPLLDQMILQLTDGFPCGESLDIPETVRIIRQSFPSDFGVVDPVSTHHEEPLCVMHRVIGQKHIYAVYGTAKDSACFFRAKGRIELWDPWTGTVKPVTATRIEDHGTVIRMPLEANEIQIIVFNPGDADIEEDEQPQKSPDEIISLDGDWDFILEPTLDNTWGDFRLPPSKKLLSAEIRRCRYAFDPEGIGETDGWMQKDWDASRWELVTLGFEAQFWKLGPLPDSLDLSYLEEQLAKLTAVHPEQPVLLDGTSYFWRAYRFSWNKGIEDDPGHQGYHGLKEDMHAEFIALGQLNETYTSTHRIPEFAGNRYYLWTTVIAPQPGRAKRWSGGFLPDQVWLNGVTAATEGTLTVNQGANSLLLRYTGTGKGFFFIADPAFIPPPESRALPLQTRWSDANGRLPGIFPFDPNPFPGNAAGWYRFTTAPGLRGFSFQSYGPAQAWVDGQPTRLENATPNPAPGELIQHCVVLPASIPHGVQVTVRVQHTPGLYSGAGIADPILLECAQGRLAAGDWSAFDGLSCYSGGARYRQEICLTAKQAAAQAMLALGEVVSSAEVIVNGKSAGVRVAPAWKFDLSGLLHAGENQLEILVFNTLANHYQTIPTRYRGSVRSGLLGPVTLEFR